MKRFLTFSFLLFNFLDLLGTERDSVINYLLPDSVRAVSFLADISLGTLNTKKEVFAGIKTHMVKLSLESDRKEREVVFEFPSGSQIMAKGIGIKTEKDELSWKYNWSENKNYKLMIATAGDSAGYFALYSGYIFLPDEKKWKQIGTCKIPGQWNTIKQPAAFCSEIVKNPMKININEAWIQRTNGSWKNLLQTSFALPVVNLFSHVDSLAQLEIEKKQIVPNFFPPDEFPQPSNVIVEAYNKFIKDGVYYWMMNEGTGKQVSVNDTVTVYYKGMLLDGSVFDETKDKPATFPLTRLIRGWQIGVPLCKVGGKIRLVIPSNLAYSIRTRSAKIPPNSILVFEIEVVDATSPQ